MIKKSLKQVTEIEKTYNDKGGDEKEWRKNNEER